MRALIAAAAAMFVMAASAGAAVGPKPVFDPSVLEWDDYGTRTVVLRNIGDASVSMSSQAYPAPAFGWQVIGTTCNLSFSIAPGGWCTATFTHYPPSVFTSATQFHSVGTNAGTISVALVHRTALIPAVSPGGAFFATIPTGATDSLTVSVENPTAAPMALSTLETSQPPFSATGGTCLAASPFTLAPFSTCTVVYTFAPAAAGFYQAFFAIGTSAGSRIFHGAATATAPPAAPVASLAPTSHDFGLLPTGARPTVTATLANAGDAPMTLSSFATSAAPFAVVGGTCAAGSAYAPGASCTLVYGPTSDADGDRTLSVTTDGGTRSIRLVVDFADNVAPTIATAPDVTVPANASCVATPILDPPAASDDVGVVSVTRSPAGADFALGSTVVTWTATDAAGNSASSQHTVTVADETPPTVTAPADANVGDGDDSSPAATGTAAASDNCPGVAVAHSDASAAGAGYTRVITRTWTATDGAGATASSVQTIRELDETPPTLAIPPDATVELGGDTSPAATGTATGADLNGVTIAHSDVTSGGTVERTWTATDGVGNVASATQTISIVDTTPPALAVPPDTTVELGSDTSPTATGVATAIDLAGATVSYADALSGSTIERTWTATDPSGNSSSDVQTITLADTTPPVLAAPPPVTAFTGPGDTTGTAFVPSLGTATAGDLGPPVAIEITGVPAGSLFPIGATTVTYTATDAAGNEATATQLVTVVDDTAPVIDVGSLTVQAATIVGAPVVYPVEASDNGGSVSVSCSPLQGTTFAVGTTTVTCTATDAAGNSASDTGAVTVLEPEPLARLATLSNVCWSLGFSPSGIAQSLCGKLDQAALALARGRSACGQLGGFLNEIRAQRGKKVSEAQFAALIDSRAVAAVLGCR